MNPIAGCRASTFWTSVEPHRPVPTMKTNSGVWVIDRATGYSPR